MKENKMLQTALAIIFTVVALPLFIAPANILFVEAPIDFIRKLSSRGNR